MSNRSDRSCRSRPYERREPSAPVRRLSAAIANVPPVLLQIAPDRVEPLVRQVVGVDGVLERAVERLDLGHHRLGLGALWSEPGPVRRSRCRPRQGGEGRSTLLSAANWDLRKSFWPPRNPHPSRPECAVPERHKLGTLTTVPDGRKRGMASARGRVAARARAREGFRTLCAGALCGVAIGAALVAGGGAETPDDLEAQADALRTRNEALAAGSQSAFASLSDDREPARPGEGRARVVPCPFRRDPGEAPRRRPCRPRSSVPRSAARGRRLHAAPPEIYEEGPPRRPRDPPRRRLPRRGPDAVETLDLAARQDEDLVRPRPRRRARLAHLGRSLAPRAARARPARRG